MIVDDSWGTWCHKRFQRWADFSFSRFLHFIHILPAWSTRTWMCPKPFAMSESSKRWRKRQDPVPAGAKIRWICRYPLVIQQRSGTSPFSLGKSSIRFPWIYRKVSRFITSITVDRIYLKSKLLMNRGCPKSGTEPHNFNTVFLRQSGNIWF